LVLKVPVDQLEVSVSPVQMDPLVVEEMLEPREPRVLLVVQELRVRVEHLDNLGPVEHLEQMDSLVKQEILDPRVNPALLAVQDP